MDHEVREFREVLDHYLFADLETMADVQTDRGGLGYPMIQTILAAMELVGMLISGSHDGGAFDKFWSELSKDRPTYKRARAVFRAIRNSAAHLFLVHAGIQLTKNAKGHMTRTQDGLVNVDLLRFYEDFRATYERLMDEVATGSREAKGYPKVVEQLTKERREIRELAASLPSYPLYKVPIVTADGTEAPYSGGTISFFTPSATPFPFQEDDETSAS
jgi:hypothetical protein